MECALPLFINVFFSQSNKPSWESIKSDFFVAEIVLKDKKKPAKLIVNYEESFYQHEICTQKKSYNLLIQKMTGIFSPRKFSF